MRKKTGAVLMVILLLVLGSFAAWYFLTADQRGRAVAVQQMPEFIASTEEGTEVRNEDLERKKGVLFFISTSCPHCRNEMNDLGAKADIFEDPVYVVSSTPDIFGKFAADHGIDKENITLLHAPKQTFRNFQITTVPQALIYDRKGRLIERIEGYYPMEDIAAYLD